MNKIKLINLRYNAKITFKFKQVCLNFYCTLYIKNKKSSRIFLLKKNLNFKKLFN